MSEPEIDGGSRQPPGSFDAAELVRGLQEGRQAVVNWLRSRVERVAARRFSRWAWDWIRDDLVSDLVLQLTVTVTREGFAFQGSPRSYVDAAINNLCKSYFLRLARLRRGVSLDDEHGEIPDRGSGTLDRVAAALELRRLLHGVSPQCRKLLTCKYLAGMSLKEIAADSGVDAKTVRSRLHTCRERLRRVREPPAGFRAPAPNIPGARDSSTGRGRGMKG